MKKSAWFVCGISALAAILSLTGCAERNASKVPEDTVVAAGNREIQKETLTEAVHENKENTEEITDTITLQDNEKPLRLEENVVYETISLENMSLQLTAEAGRGWAIDINSDGRPENLYMGPEGVYVEGVLAVPLDENEENDIFWLIDVDTEDGYIELLTYQNMAYDLWFYDKEGCLKSAGQNVCGWFNRYVENEEAEDIRNPVRIDEQTISFRDRFYVFDSYNLTACYRLNEEHKLTVVPEEYKIETPHPIAFIGEQKTLKLYRERSKQGEFSVIEEPTAFTLTTSDGNSWVYLDNYNGESGWIYIEENESGDMLINGELEREDFIGYSNIS